jgi:hypothetical protein
VPVLTKAPRPSPSNPIGRHFCATGLSQAVLQFSAQHSRYALLEALDLFQRSAQGRVLVGIGEPVMEALSKGSGHCCGDSIAVALR